jgi:predicted nucleic acid-binding protein
LILLDTNVLVYALNADSPQHADCRRVVDLAAADRLPAVLLPQILIESYAVITSPRRTGRALAPQEAWRVLRSISRTIQVRPVPETMLDDLGFVLEQHPRRGRDIFDLAIVTQMITHGIRTICTCNTRDFGFAGIHAIDPARTLSVYA